MIAAVVLQGNVRAQTTEDSKKTYFENISIEPDGHVCYREALDNNPLNRIEYRTNGKCVLDILQSTGSKSTKIEVTDFNNDGKVDLIYIEKGEGETKIEKIDFYRGPEYLNHLKRHLSHALRTAMHPLIKDQPEEQRRAKQIEASLNLLNKRQMTNDEVGVYTTDRQFEVSDHKDIQYAFIASDTLSVALRSIIGGDYRILSQEPEITKKYNLEINILMSIDPSLRRGK